MESLLPISNPFGGKVWYKERTGSTMDDIAALVRRGEPSGTIAVGGYQASGRGRFADRKWDAEPGEALLFSIALGRSDPGGARSPRAAFAPSLRLALGVARFLESLALSPSIKWPNDVLLDGRKACGILVTVNRGLLFAGIGLNLRQRSFPREGLRQPAISLLLAGRDLAPERALAGLLPFLHAAYLDPNPRPEVERRLESLQGRVEVIERQSEPARSGRLLGLDADGAMLLETEDGIVRIISGE